MKVSELGENMTNWKKKKKNGKNLLDFFIPNLDFSDTAAHMQSIIT